MFPANEFGQFRTKRREITTVTPSTNQKRLKKKIKIMLTLTKLLATASVIATTVQGGMMPGDMDGMGGGNHGMNAPSGSNNGGDHGMNTPSGSNNMDDNTGDQSHNMGAGGQSSGSENWRYCGVGTVWNDNEQLCIATHEGLLEACRVERGEWAFTCESLVECDANSDDDGNMQAPAGNTGDQSSHNMNDGMTGGNNLFQAPAPSAMESHSMGSGGDGMAIDGTNHGMQAPAPSFNGMNMGGNTGDQSSHNDGMGNHGMQGPAPSDRMNMGGNTGDQSHNMDDGMMGGNHGMQAPAPSLSSFLGGMIRL